jgi:AAA15 family ATPase/GTPase
MLIEFTVSNFRYIRDKQRFSMLAAQRIKEHPDNVTQSENYNIINSSIIYGRNGSGKSNLIKAIYALQSLITSQRPFSERFNRRSKRQKQIG